MAMTQTLIPAPRSSRNAYAAARHLLGADGACGPGGPYLQMLGPQAGDMQDHLHRIEHLRSTGRRDRRHGQTDERLLAKKFQDGHTAAARPLATRCVGEGLAEQAQDRATVDLLPQTHQREPGLTALLEESFASRSETWPPRATARRPEGRHHRARGGTAGSALRRPTWTAPDDSHPAQRPEDTT